MLTRLKVNGFKNLVDVDVRFGPFTVIAGANGTGKSNLFDAIHFLSLLADKTLLEAAQAIRTDKGESADIRQLFHHVGDRFAPSMSFEAEMIVPRYGVDELGQPAQASITFVRYRVELAYRINEALPALGGLEVLREELDQINLGEAGRRLAFPHAARWRKSVVEGRRTSPFISTDGANAERIVKLHQDGESGRPKQFRAATLPRTILSSVNATENPTALLARREMQSWRLLQLEPTALRRSDSFTTPPGLGSDGSSLPATLHYLARAQRANGANGKSENTQLYEQVAQRLADLIDDVRTVRIDRDEQRQLLTLEISDRNNTVYPARALSHGTLRFLALAVLELDPQALGVICLEEPENGIHPLRIPAMLQLLQDIAVDTNEPVDTDNPLRQVIVNTHSPAVVLQAPEDALLVAESVQSMDAQGQRFRSARFGWLPDTWRSHAEPHVRPIPKGQMLAYLRPVADEDQPTSANSYMSSRERHSATRRVMDRSDLQPSLYQPDEGAE